MTAIIMENPREKDIPENSIRADLAWKLFLPDFMGDIPPIGKVKIEPIRHWLWNELSKRLGYMRQFEERSAYIITPLLTDEGKEFLIRICSIWTDSVHLMREGDKGIDKNSPGPNLWIPPIINVDSRPEEGSALGRLTKNNDSGLDTHYSPILGAGKSYVRAYTIEKNGTYSRFHSHTAREELYLVLKGKGTLRIGSHSVAVKEGDLIGKPTGPDISTQFLADRGESMRVLDIEIWPDDERMSKDAVLYPDHEELDLFGQGWNFTIPSSSIMDSRDAMTHYHDGYRRKLDGTWEPKEIPGHRKREE